MKKKIKIANAGGFWGDDLGAFKRQITMGQVDYISADYLAEITMSILKKQQLKDPDLGYVTDFIPQIIEIAPYIKEKDVKILTNAGGINPVACAKKLTEELQKINVSLKIVVIEGDDIIDRIDEFYPEIARFKNLENNEDFVEVKNKVQSANIYLGVLPLLKALSLNPDIILAGRVTDTSITMAPMIHEFCWELNDWDKLASGLVAGHIIECGAQGSGGNFTDWSSVGKWDNFGYPIVEAFPDASFIVEKHMNTGGIINVDVVREQLLYELGNPRNYISPNVIVDFTSIQLADLGNNRVRVSGVKGYPSTKSFKVSMAYENGFTSNSSIIISGGNALEKAKTFDSIFWKRLPVAFEKKDSAFVGYDSCHKNLAKDIIPNEILLRLSVYDQDKSKLNEFSKSIAPLILSGPQGAAVTSGRPRIHNVVSYWPTLIPKTAVSSFAVEINEDGTIREKYEVSLVTGHEESIDELETNTQISDEIVILTENHTEHEIEVKLIEICLARSGDKGDMANIGVIARNQMVFDYIKLYLTANYMKDLFKEFCKGRVIRYELDNLLSLNFLLENSLDGGGTQSLRIDPQGKTLASALLNQKFTIPVEVFDSLKVQKI